MLDERSKELRRLIIRMIEQGRRGHVGPAGSIVEILRVLYDHWLKVKPAEPQWEDRDRFILSKGHGCLALYAVLADKGFFAMSELDSFCSQESTLGGHPEHRVPGVEASTGALGHGLSIGVGMALAAKINKKNHRVAVVVGDGEINEGAIWEAAMSAAKHKLSNLTVFIDYNKLQSYGPTRIVLDLEPLVEKWRAFGFEVDEIDGHDPSEILQTLRQLPFCDDKPSAVVCHTIKGRGFPMAENEPVWHHKSNLSDDDIQELYQALK